MIRKISAAFACGALGGRASAAIGALLIAWLTLKEGQEAFGKANGLICCCHGKCSGIFS